MQFDRGHRTLQAHFPLGIAKVDTLPPPLYTLDITTVIIKKLLILKTVVAKGSSDKK